MIAVSTIEWIVAQSTSLGSNLATESYTVGAIPELVIILIIFTISILARLADGAIAQAGLSIFLC